MADWLQLDPNVLPWMRRQGEAAREATEQFQFGAQMAERRRQNQIDNAYRNRVLQLQQETMELKRVSELQSREGMVEMGRVLSEISVNGDWTNPAAKAKFFDVVTRYPALASSPIYDNLLQTFQAAEDNKLRRDLANQQTTQGFAPGPLEKDIEYYKTVLAEGDPEIVRLVKSTLEARAMKSGLSIKFGPDGKIEEMRQGPQANAVSPEVPTTAFRTQLQQQLHSHDTSMAALAHIEKNIDASDFGLRGMAKELRSKIGGQLGMNIDPKDMDVRNSLKQLRQDLFKSLRSDSNIAEGERKIIEGMLPEVEMFDVVESLPSAVGKLMTVKRRLQESSRSAAQKLGVLPPLWTLSNDEIATAVKAGQLNRDEALRFLMENR